MVGDGQEMTKAASGVPASLPVSVSALTWGHAPTGHIDPAPSPTPGAGWVAGGSA